MKRILIVEDNRMLSNLYRSTIAMAGFDVEVAADGPSGLAAIRKTRPDLVLLVLMLPGMDGLQVLPAVRAEPDLAAVPVIVLSNSYTSERMQELWEAGATQVLVKASTSPKMVLDVVRNGLGGAK